MKLAFLTLALLVTCPHNNIAIAQPSPQIKLWAAVGVSQSVFQLHEAEKMAVSFIVVNDGQTEANPHVESSHLFINGVEPKDWIMVIGNGLRSSYFWALPPGKILSFGYQLGPRYFSKPGIYTLRWESQNFSSSTVTFRVLPEGNWY
jgi:hypothetical protein